MRPSARPLGTTGPRPRDIVAERRAMAGKSSKRGPDTNKYVVEIGGEYAGWLADVSGATACGDMETGPRGRIRNRRDEIACACWPAMPRPFFAWIERSFGEAVRGTDGSIALVDPDGNLLSQMLFQEGVVTGLHVPGHDRTTREAAKLGIKFSPGGVQQSYRRAQRVPPEINAERSPRPAHDLRLDIDGLAEECSFVRRFEAMSVVQSISARPGEGLVRSRPVAATPLKITLPESKARGFVQWYERVPRGAASQRTATLTLGAPEVGFSVVLHHLRLVKLTYEEATLDGEGPSRLRRDAKVEMIATTVDFCFLPGK